jgi:methionyl-tRNA formyltransferase
VKAAALELGLPVTTRIEDVLEAGVELGVVVAFGRIIKDEILDRVPMVNAHFSLLPRWRGAAPVERAILAGDAETGVCLMAIDAGLDTGPVFRCERTPIGEEETADELRARLSDLAAGMLLEALQSGLGDPVAQEGEATYAAKLEPAELRLDWNRPAVELHRVVRVGRAWTTFRGRRLLVLRARVASGTTGPESSESAAGLDGRGESVGPADSTPPGTVAGTSVRCGEGTLELITVQPEGRAALPAADWLRGARPVPGETLGS